MTFDPPGRCDICGNLERRELHWALVQWADARPGMAYEHVPACRDRAECRARVESQGDTWPLVNVSRDTA